MQTENLPTAYLLRKVRSDWFLRVSTELQHLDGKSPSKLAGQSKEDPTSIRVSVDYSGGAETIDVQFVQSSKDVIAVQWTADLPEQVATRIESATDVVRMELPSDPDDLYAPLRSLYRRGRVEA